MPARLDLPDYDIVHLKDGEGMSFREIKEALELDCHIDTIRRHYNEYIAGIDTEIKELIDNIEEEENGLIKDYATRRTEKVSWWQKVKNWYRRVSQG